jgi:hypothetical protein
VRQHIADTVALLAAKMTALVEALRDGDEQDAITVALDIRDLLLDEQAWLRALMPGMDRDALTTLTTYRLFLVRAQLLGDVYVVSLNGRDIGPWMTALTEVARVTDGLGTVPE